jgi:hypothetical protein
MVPNAAEFARKPKTSPNSDYLRTKAGHGHTMPVTRAHVNSNAKLTSAEKSKIHKLKPIAATHGKRNPSLLIGGPPEHWHEACVRLGYQLKNLPASNFRLEVPLVMRIFASLVLVVAVFFGQYARVMAQDPCQVLASQYQNDHPDHHHEDHTPCDPSHDEDCPSHHHHHCGTVCQVVPLISENEIKCGAPWRLSDNLRPRQESELMPEDPYLSSEKPPII